MEISDFRDFLETPINGLLKLLGNELKQVAKNRIIEYQTNEYKRNYFTKTLLHRSEPVKLDEFYLPLHITFYEGGKARRKSKEESISTEDVSKLFKKTNYIAIIGSAGSGKSTIVKYLFLDSVKRNFKIPIKVELRYLNDYKGSIADFIFDEIFTFHKLGFSKEIIDRLATSGNFIFFFDGYDEINSNKKEQVTNDIDQFVSKYFSNYYLITSRPYTNIDTLPLFTNYKVSDLLDSEIPAFVKKQIPNSEEEMAEKMIKAISQIDNRSYKTFLSNPLLLSMFILTYQSYSEIPQKRSDFYKQVFDTLYSVHDSVSKLSFVREKQSGLSKEKFEELLKLFSFISYFEEKFLFQPDYLEGKLSFIKSKKKTFEFDNQKVIEDLQVAIGILNKEGIDYTFPHRSLQEFFAANYISGLSDKNKLVIFKKIKESIEDRWFYLIDNHHFLTLLGEQDYNSILNLLVLPLLKNEFEKAAKTKITDHNEKYDIICKVFLISAHLIQSEQREEKIQKDFCNDHRPKVIIMINDKSKFSLPDKKFEEVKKKDVDSSFEFLTKNSEIWIKDIQKNLDELEKSDSDIIEII